MASTSRPRLGIAFVPTLPPESLPDLARAADEHLDDLWVWEDCFKQSGIASAATALASTSRVRVGLGLMPAALRNVAIAAMEVATLARLFPGRFVPGVGHGVQEWMAQGGARVASPMTLLEEYTDALLRLLAGEEVTTEGRYVRLDRVRLDWPPMTPVTLMSGGHGPRTLALAARLVDGVLLAGGLGHDDLRSAVDTIRGVRPAGSTVPEVVHTLMADTGPGADERVVADLAAWGLEPTGGRAVVGDAAAVAAAVRRCGELGATTVVLQPTSGTDAAAFAAWAGREVRPLLG
ncbi:LLM class flavin-dependent oxidoreductase [Phycicoccus ginsengisoli]